MIGLKVDIRRGNLSSNYFHTHKLAGTKPPGPWMMVDIIILVKNTETLL